MTYTEDCGSTPRFTWCLHPRTATMMCARHWINLRCCDEKICGLEMASSKEDSYSTWNKSFYHHCISRLLTQNHLSCLSSHLLSASHFRNKIVAVQWTRKLSLSPLSACNDQCCCYQPQLKPQVSNVIFVKAYIMCSSCKLCYIPLMI